MRSGSHVLVQIKIGRDFAGALRTEQPVRALDHGLDLIGIENREHDRRALLTERSERVGRRGA